MATLQVGAAGAEVVLGALTLTGSLMAFGKLQGLLPGRPTTFPLQNQLNWALIAGTLALTAFLVHSPGAAWAFWTIAAAGLLLGVTLVLPIGGADIPVVVCLLNSYAGPAASAPGFALRPNTPLTLRAPPRGPGFPPRGPSVHALDRA